MNSLLAAAMVKAMTKAGELQPKPEYTPRGGIQVSQPYFIAEQERVSSVQSALAYLVIIVSGQEGARNALGARGDINEVVSQK